jgi:hypothetical protein
MRSVKVAVAARRRGFFQRITAIPKSPTTVGPKVPCCHEKVVLLIVVMVAVALYGPLPRSAMESGCTIHVGSAGETEQVRATVAVEPFCRVSDTSNCVFCPATMVLVFGVATIVNAGGAELMTSVNVLDMLVANSESPL